ncbi:hypothetical protein FG379_003337 [Cryptosporidium bovis]|uniref:uncharacterized protein n=1 Tax=Cryptosporidium bovis TaxID=310047 RepID=UPI00351A27BC|nr:hypothetical protein FG379_003337 [Cryptosporidium bovis]
MLIWRRIKTRSFFNNWINIRENEGVSQRVQEDTIRVVKLVESLYFKIVMSVIRAVTHIPVIIHLSKEVGGIPLFPPDSKYSLIIYMILSLFVSVFLVYLTSKDLSFKIVEKEIKEASFRKKLIIEEDQEFLFNTFSMSSILDDITLIHKEIYLYLFKYDLTSGFLREIIQFLPTILLVPSIIKGSI